jgi:hypothetical protein
MPRSTTDRNGRLRFPRARRDPDRSPDRGRTARCSTVARHDNLVSSGAAFISSSISSGMSSSTRSNIVDKVCDYMLEPIGINIL